MKLACACEGSAETILEQYADLVAVGTVADVMPLVDENRYLVRWAWKAERGSPRRASPPCCGRPVSIRSD